MSIETKLECLRLAGGNLGRAETLYDWVTGRSEPVAGPMRVAYPVPGSASDVVRGVGINVGVPVGSAVARTAG
jgi:hypothetical protein